MRAAHVAAVTAFEVDLCLLDHGYLTLALLLVNHDFGPLFAGLQVLGAAY